MSRYLLEGSTSIENYLIKQEKNLHCIFDNPQTLMSLEVFLVRRTFFFSFFLLKRIRVDDWRCHSAC